MINFPSLLLFSHISPRQKIIWLTVLFLSVRFLSFFTYQNHFLNGIIALVLILGFVYIAFKNLTLAWWILVAELLLDGAGHFFEFQGLILRTWFLGIFGLIWLYQKIKDKKIMVGLPRPLIVGLVASLTVIVLAVIRGLYFGHGTMLVLQDTVLYLFILLLFPALEFGTTENLKTYIKVFIVGSTVFSLITFFIYSSGLALLQGPYYHWFRDIAGGKITDLGLHFFRITLSEQILLVPIILILCSRLLDEYKNKWLWFYTILGLVALEINFTRIYLLALAFGILILVYKTSLLKWLRLCLILSLISIITFVSLNLVATRGAAWGQQILGFKASGLTSPTSDLSGAIRLAMLPDIFKTIKKHPLFGSGLATTVSYSDPLTKEIVSRTQFDWGYLEMIAELGMVGTAVYILFLLILLYYLFRLAYYHNEDNEKRSLFRGLFVGALSLFVINLTTPALFQGFGVLYFVLLIVVINKKILV